MKRLALQLDRFLVLMSLSQSSVGCEVLVNAEAGVSLDHKLSYDVATFLEVYLSKRTRCALSISSMF